MNRKEIEKCLIDALRSDDQVRREAEIMITNLQYKDYAYFIQSMVEIFADITSDKQLKSISGIILKNSLHSNDQKIQNLYSEQWLNINEQNRENLKKIIIGSFSGKDSQICLLAGSILGFIARIELAQGMDLNFFASMEYLSKDNSNASAVFESINVSCEKLLMETTFNFDNVSDVIFSICMSKLEDTSVPSEIKEDALKCLLTIFEAIAFVFEKEQNVMRFLQDIAICANVDLNLTNKALICLNRFIFIFYKFISGKIDAISDYIGYFWNSQSEEVRVQVVEFWTIVAEKKDVDLDKYMPIVLPNIIKYIKKNEDTFDNNWNAHKATAYFLEVLTEIYGSRILLHPLVFKFVEAELNSNDKYRIDIGAITLGCVVAKDCDHNIINFVKILVAGIRDPVTIDSCLYALAKICEVDFLAVVEHLTFLVKEICVLIEHGTLAATNSAWILNSVYISMNKLKNPTIYSLKMPLESQIKMKEYAESQLSTLHPFIVHVLVNAIENADMENSAYRVSLFAALTEAVIYSEDTRLDILNECMVYCTRKMSEGAILISKSAVNYVLVLEDVLSNYITLSETIIRIRKNDTSDIFYPIYLEILKGRPSSAIGEVYIALTNNISIFINRLDNIMPFITRDISCLDMFILKCAINLIGCMANLMQSEFFEISSQVIPLLVQNLSSKNVYKEVKSQILSVFGDIALALGVNFEQYLDMSIVIFLQVVSLDRKSDEEYIDELRYNILQTFDCIVLATCESQRLREILNKLVEGIKVIALDTNTDKTLLALVSLLKDLQNIFGNQYGLSCRWVDELHSKCLDSKCPQLRKAVLDASK